MSKTMIQPSLTIFTPTYNRADLLPRLFDSIKQQVLPGDTVEWLVIDDGSTDATPEVLAAFSAERTDLVRYERVPNGGKHRAINRAAQLAKGDWVMIVDSDDLVASGAIEKIRTLLTSVHEDARVGLLRGLKHFPELPHQSTRFLVPRNPCHHFEWLSAQAGFDTAEVIRTKVLNMYPFPEHPGERFMAESWLWYSLDKTHVTFFCDQAWIKCFYQAGGLSAQSGLIRANSPLSAMDVYQEIYESPVRWPVRIRAAVNWWRYCFHARRINSYRLSEKPVSRLFMLAGWIFRWRDRCVIRIATYRSEAGR